MGDGGTQVIEGCGGDISEGWTDIDDGGSAFIGDGGTTF